MKKELNKIHEIYLFKRKKVLSLWDEIITKGETGNIVRNAKTVEDANSYFNGYLNKNKRLKDMLIELDNDYFDLVKLYSTSSCLANLFSWLPFGKIKELKATIAEFKDKWDKYIPGW